MSIDKRCIYLSVLSLVCMIGVTLSSCNRRKGDVVPVAYTDVIADSISRIASEYPGEIGVAIIINDSDTVTVNDRCVYPMMSVFKVHQALAVCDSFDREGLSLDSVMSFRRDGLDADTWSPMLKEHQEPVIRLTVRDLLRYTLIQSDNNASNLMFRELAGVSATDSLIATLISRESFRIAYSEEEMAADHDKAYANRTSPLGAAILMNRLFTDSLVSRDKQAFIMQTLGECATGKDRIAAPLLGKKGVAIAHKTGSGYINEEGELVAHNDVAYIRMPGNVSYTLAVFVKDFKGDAARASEAIARISAAVFALLSESDV